MSVIKINVNDKNRTNVQMNIYYRLTYFMK